MYILPVHATTVSAYVCSENQTRPSALRTIDMRQTMDPWYFKATQSLFLQCENDSCASVIVHSHQTKRAVSESQKFRIASWCTAELASTMSTKSGFHFDRAVQIIERLSNYWKEGLEVDIVPLSEGAWFWNALLHLRKNFMVVIFWKFVICFIGIRAVNFLGVQKRFCPNFCKFAWITFIPQKFCVKLFCCCWYIVLSYTMPP